MEIRFDEVTKVYPGNIRGLDNISLTIDERGTFGLLGRNGAGKTTFLRLITTLLEPTKGRIRILDGNGERNKKDIRKLIGYLPQNFGVYPELTACEFLDYMGILYELGDAATRSEAVRLVLEMVHLEGVMHRKLRTFSGGMIQRIGIAQALLNAPRILLVDEPTANLDPEERVEFRNLLSEMSAGRIVIISTHIVNDIASTCSDMAILAEGSIRFQGKPARLIEEARGNVFEITIDTGEFENAKKNYTITSIVRNDTHVLLRVVSRETVPGGRSLEPTLEDAYILNMKES
jgi:ABC-2 type transport system ATP-binding protein